MKNLMKKSREWLNRYQMEAGKVNELLSDDDKKNIRADIVCKKGC